MSKVELISLTPDAEKTMAYKSKQSKQSEKWRLFKTIELLY